MTIATEGASHDPVVITDLQDWASYFGLTFPVLADPTNIVDGLYDPSARSRPTYVLLSPGAVIETLGMEPSASQIEAVLPIAYP